MMYIYIYIYTYLKKPLTKIIQYFTGCSLKLPAISCQRYLTFYLSEREFLLAQMTILI